MTGKTISHYRVLEKLGAGGMGVVYKAEDLRLRRMVALKFLPEGAAADPTALARFQREARTASALDHPNICTIFEVDEANGQPFLAMQLLSGQTLRERIAAGPISLAEILEWGIQIADALGAAHDSHIIHRDLKPANIFITQRGQAKILDFGLAKLVEDRKTALATAGVTTVSDSPSLSETGAVAGTIAYMSPEQARGEELDNRSDIFSFGAVLYEMATGRNAFAGDTAAIVFHAILSGTLTSPRQYVPGLPLALEQVIRKALHTQPAQRFQTAQQMQNALAQARDAGTNYRSVSALSRTVLWTRPGPSFAAWKKWSLVTLGCASFAGAAFFIRLHPRVPFVVSQSAQASPSLPANMNLAVLPIGLPGDSTQLRALAGGLVDGITARLAQLTSTHDLQVVAAAQIRGKNISTAQDARKQFGANLDLAIKLQQTGDMVRAEWTLLDGAKGSALKTGSALAAESNLFAIEDQVADGVTQALQIKLRPDDQRALKAHGTISPDAYRFYLEGRGYLDDPRKPGSLQSAETFFKHALQQDPNYGAAEAGLGSVYLNKFADTKARADLLKAREHCGKAIAHDSGGDGHICLGALANASGNYRQAVEEFRSASELAPSDDQGFTGLADAYQKINRPAEAEAAYLQAIQLRPDYWRPYSLLGVFYLGQAQYDKAEKMFQTSARLAPESFQSWNALGAALLYQGRANEAVAPLVRSIAIYPTVEAHSNLGTVYYQLKRYSDAAKNYRAALQLDATDDQNWTNLADALFFAGDKPASMLAYRKALALEEEQLKTNASDPELLSRTADNYSVLHEREKALDLLHRALQVTGGSKEVLFTAAMVYKDLGETGMALEWLTKAVHAGYSRAVIQNAPALNELRNDERYRQLMR